MKKTTPSRTVGRPKGPVKVKTTMRFTPPAKSMIMQVTKNHKKPSLDATLLDAVLHTYPDAPGILARETEAYAKKINQGQHRDAKAVSEEFAG